jgi:phage baseplate assembly protein W
MSSFLGFPFAPDARGRSPQVARDRHIRDMIEQVLLTAPGERAMRPDFGCGVKELLFQPASDALAAATQQMIHGALLRWLEGWVTVQRVTVEASDSALLVTVSYTPLPGGAIAQERFTLAAGGAP